MAQAEQINKSLVDGLRQAKTKRMFFALVLKGGTDGGLIISKIKIPPRDISEVKKETGGSMVIKGACFGEQDKLIFEVAVLPSPTAAKAVKTIAHRDAGLTINPEFRLGDAPDLHEGEEAESETESEPIADNSSAPSGSPVLGTMDAIKLVAANNAWKQARNHALEGMQQLEYALRATEDAVGEAVADVIVDLAANFPRTLDATLEQLAQAARKGDAAASRQWKAAGQQGIKQCLTYLKEHAEKFSACEENDFGVGIKVHAPLTEALRDILVIIK